MLDPSVAELRLRKLKDGPLIRTLAERSDPWVLLTADDELPRRWRAVVEETRATVAIIHPTFPASHTENEWHHDVTHRWAHVLSGPGCPGTAFWDPLLPFRGRLVGERGYC